MIELLVYHPVQFGASALFGSILYLFLTTWVTNRKKRVDVPIVGPPPGQDSKKGITNVDTKELIRRGCKNVSYLPTSTSIQSIALALVVNS